MKIYVVIGSTGEYSDRNEWLIKAFRDEEDAKFLVTNATNRANQIYTLATEEDWAFHKVYEPDENPSYFNEYDPSMQMEYTKTIYYYKEVELED